jgi:hypothetical protein
VSASEKKIGQANIMKDKGIGINITTESASTKNIDSFWRIERKGIRHSRATKIGPLATTESSAKKIFTAHL